MWNLEGEGSNFNRKRRMVTVRMLSHLTPSSAGLKKEKYFKPGGGGHGREVLCGQGKDGEKRLEDFQQHGQGTQVSQTRKGGRIIEGKRGGKKRGK